MRQISHVRRTLDSSIQIQTTTNLLLKHHPQSTLQETLASPNSSCLTALGSVQFPTPPISRMSLSPAKKTSAKPGEAAATARELELLAMAMQSNKNDIQVCARVDHSYGGELVANHVIQIDYNKFAELAAFKNAASARAGW